MTEYLFEKPARHVDRVFLHCSASEAPAAGAALCRQIHHAYAGRISFHGHREVANKTCPVFDYHALLALDRWQRMP